MSASGPSGPLVYQFVVNMQDFQKDHKHFFSRILDCLGDFLSFRLPRGQPSETFSLPQANSACDGQVGNCLILTLQVKMKIK